MNLSTPSTPTPTSTPGGPLGRYLLHPGSDTSTVVHHVLRVLGEVGRTAVPALLAVAALLVVARAMLAVTRRQRAGGGHLVTVAPGPEVEPAGAEALWNGLHGVLRRGGLAGMVSGRPHVTFEVGFSSGRLRFDLWVPANVSAGRVARVVEAASPGAVTEVLPAETPVPGGSGIVGGELRLARPEWFSLRVDQPADPYRLLLAALAGLGSGEAGVVQVLARPATRRRYGRCRKAAVALRTGRPRSKLVRFIDFWMTKGVPQRPSLSADPTRAGEVRAITEKAASLCFEAIVRYGIVTPTGGHGARQQLKAEGHGLVGAFAMFDGRNHLTRRRLPRPWQALFARHLGKGDLYSVGELAALAHLPLDRSVAGLSRAGAHAVAPPPEVVIVVIPGGFSSEAIARALQLGGVIAESQAFESRARARNLSQSFKAGVYRFEKGLPLDKVIDRLVAGP